MTWKSLKPIISGFFIEEGKREESQDKRQEQRGVSAVPSRCGWQMKQCATRRGEDSYVSCSALSRVHKGLIEGPMSSACQIVLNMPIVKKIKIFNNQAVSQEISTVPAQTFTFSLIRQLLRNERFLSTVCTSPQMSGSGSKKNA